MAIGVNTDEIGAYGLRSANHLNDRKTSDNNDVTHISANGPNNFDVTQVNGLNNCNKTVPDNNNYINVNTAFEICGASQGNERYGPQCNINKNRTTITENMNDSNLDVQDRQNKSFIGNDKSYQQTWPSRVKAYLNEKKRDDHQNTSDTSDKTFDGSSSIQYVYLGVVRQGEPSYGPKMFDHWMQSIAAFFRGVFIWKYRKDTDEACRYMRQIPYLTDEDVDKFLKGERKPKCTVCQYYCFLTCLTLTGGFMPPTPSSYSSPNSFHAKWQKLIKTPMYPTTLTEQQYNDLYGDFKLANDEMSKDPTLLKRVGELSELVEEEMRKIVHSFTSEVFTTLVDEYLKLFEEMVKSLILLKETGITLEDICPIDEESHAYYCHQAGWTENIHSKVSFCQPYNAAEFEELLLDQLKQFRFKRDAKCAHILYREAKRYPMPKKYHLICDCKRNATKYNPYFDFLSEISLNGIPSINTEELDEILRTEKQMFLKCCLELLRDNNYFRVHSQSSSESVANAGHSSIDRTQEDIIDNEMNKMSVRIYNKTICHVQSSIFAIFRSMKYKNSKTRLLPPTPGTCHFERNKEVDETTDLIQNALSDYLNVTDREASPEDEVFLQESLNKDHCVVDPTLKQHSIKYEDEIKHQDDKYRDRQLKYEPESNVHEKAFVQHEIKQQHPDLDYADNSRHIKERSRNFPTENSQEHTAKSNAQYDLQNVAETDLYLQKMQGYTAPQFLPLKAVSNRDKTVILPPTPRETEACFFNKTLFTKKKKDASVICVLNYYKPEISHVDAIMFLRKMDTEGGVLHYPHCNENTFLTKMVGPSFYLSVCCADCHQELAPPQKLEAFISKPKNSQRSKLVSHIIKKSRAPYYSPVRCGSCYHFLCDPEKGKKLFVPFHSETKGYICASRLKSHICETDTSGKEYRGCPSDGINSCNTQDLHKLNEKHTTPRESQVCFNKTPKQRCMVRSRSLPILRYNDLECGAIIENEKETARMKVPLKFEDAVANILNMWTYEMIDYEKGANSPHLRSQILNYRKSLSIFIKKDIREKLYCRHILSVFKRVEDYESPILDFKNNPSTQKDTMNCKIMRKSRSCHSQLSYETRRSKFESLECKNHSATLQNTHQIEDSRKSFRGSYLRPNILNRNNMTRPLSLHSELKQKSPAAQRRRSYSFTESAYKEDISIQMHAWKNELQKLQKSIDSPDFASEILNRKNMTRPVSLHSELKQKSAIAPHRRRSSCSFATESRYEDYSTQITVWKNKLLKLEKSVESPYLGTEHLNRNNTTRPLSLHSEVNRKPAQRRRSCSFTESMYKEDLSTQIGAWKNKLQELQKNVETPNLRFGAINSINYTKDDSLRTAPERTTSSVTHRPKSESFLNQFSAQINKSKVELLKLQKSFESLRLRTRTTNGEAAVVPDRRQSESVINKQYASELSAWKNELLKLQKSVESPYLKSGARDRKINVMVDSLGSESKRMNCTAVPPLKSELEDSLSELKTWNHTLRELERDATSPHWKTGTINRRVKTRALSLHAEPKRITNLHRNRPKSESVLDDFSTELETWKHELLTLEEDARNPQPEAQKRKYMAKSRSLNSDHNPTVHRVSFEAIDNNGGPSRRNTEVPQTLKLLETNTRPSFQKPPVRRYSGTPRQLPATPNYKPKVENNRRHSHYETTGNFVNLLSDRKATRLNTHVQNPTISSSSYDCAESLPRQDETPNGFLRPDEVASRSRFFSQ